MRTKLTLGFGVIKQVKKQRIPATVLSMEGTSVMDWYAAMARKYQIPYKMMTAMVETIRSESL